MSEAEKLKWDGRYAAGSYSERNHPTALLAEWLPRLPRGRALDVASGRGRNALFLARNGYRVDAIDISGNALALLGDNAAAQNLDVRTIEADLDDGDAAVPRGPYDLIVLVRYINMRIVKSLMSRLSPGGAFVCEQHLVSERDVAGPSNPAFRLRPGELEAAAAGLETLFYGEGIVDDPDGRAVALARLVGIRSSAGPAHAG